MKYKAVIIVSILFLLGCAKSDEGIDVPPDLSGFGAALYFEGEVNGTQVSFNAGSRGYSVRTGTQFQNLPIWSSTFISSATVQNDGISIYFSNHSKTQGADKHSDLQQSLIAGNKNYAFGSVADVDTQEAFIIYTRNTFSYQTTDVSQSNLNFSITQVKDTLFQNQKYVIATMQFDADVYSAFKQDTLKIRNAEARMAFTSVP